MSYLQCFCQQTWCPAHSLALKPEEKHDSDQCDRKAVRRDTSRDGRQQVTSRLTVTAPLQVCDLQLQTGQHGQVLLL